MSSSNRFTPHEISKEKRKESRKVAEEVKTDFLDVDRPIPGQSYVCMSFLSPEAAVKERYLWYVKQFLEDLSADIPQPDNMPELEFKTKLQQIVTKKVNYKGISNLWEDFLYANNEKLDKQFNNEVDFRTSIRGLKIRGTYNSYREAKNRSDQIAKFDKNHHVYIGQVGYWLPWDPDPHEVPEQEYQEKELNTLMSKYRENLASKDQFFEERNREKMDQALKENKLSKQLDEKDKQILNNVRKTVLAKDKILNDSIEEKLKQEQEQEQEHKSPQTKLPSITKNDLPSITETILSSTQNNDTLSDISSSSDSESEILHGDSTKRHDTDNSMCSSFCVNTTSGEVCTGINLGNNDNNVNLSNSVANITDVFETIDPWLQNKNIK
jgi:hypothetical protein